MNKKMLILISYITYFKLLFKCYIESSVSLIVRESVDRHLKGRKVYANTGSISSIRQSCLEI